MKLDSTILLDVFVKRHGEMNPGIDHPFNVVFDSEGDLYVSSQNTNLIARYHGPSSKKGKPGTPMPLPDSLLSGKSRFSSWNLHSIGKPYVDRSARSQSGNLCTE